jgi:hypothetical protein
MVGGLVHVVGKICQQEAQIFQLLRKSGVLQLNIAPLAQSRLPKNSRQRKTMILRKTGNATMVFHRHCHGHDLARVLRLVAVGLLVVFAVARHAALFGD